MNVPQSILDEMQAPRPQPPRARRRALLLLFGMPLVLIVLCVAAFGAVFSAEILEWANEVYYAWFPLPPVPDNCPGCGMG